MRKIVAIALSAFLLSTGWVKAQNVGEAAPDFDVTLLGGGMFSLSQHAGQVVVVFLFGNTCPYCLASGPTIEADLYQQFREDPNFVMIGVDTWNSSSTESSVTGFANSTGITFPLAVKAGEVAVLPTTGS